MHKTYRNVLICLMFAGAGMLIAGLLLGERRPERRIFFLLGVTFALAATVQSLLGIWKPQLFWNKQ
jgi:hypothetical protein